MKNGYGYSYDSYWDALLGNYDAFYVVDYGEGGLPIVGHAYVLLKRSDDTWIKTEFAGTFEGYGENAFEFIKNFESAKQDAKISFKNIDAAQIINALSIEAGSETLNLDVFTLSYFSSGVQYVPLKGAFSKSISTAYRYEGSDYGGYNLLENNCLHYSKEILGAGRARNASTELLLNETETYIPMVFAVQLMSRENWY